MELKIAVLPGDGIGPEVVKEGVRVLTTVAQKWGHELSLSYADVGGVAIDRHGTPLPESSLELCRKSSAVLFGAVGGPKWDDPRSSTRPEAGLLGLRRGLGLFANLRPIYAFATLLDISPIKPEILHGTDMLVVRELTGGLYFAKPKRRWTTSRGRRGVDTLRYTEQEIERILRMGFALARTRRKHLTSVDKANVLESSRLWREVANELQEEYPDVTLEHLLVDTCAMELVHRPTRFDVVVTENTFGDILTDEAAVLVGSLGMLPSASLANIPVRQHRRKMALGLYEPIHGSAPDIAGKNKANPIATILSVALLLRYSFGLDIEAQAIEHAVNQSLEDNCRTADLVTDPNAALTTSQMGEAITGNLKS